MNQAAITPQLRCKTVFISDVHLGFKDCKAEYLLDFLQTVQCETLYLVGDIVDLWAMNNSFHWPASHYAVIRAIFNKAQSGTRVVYVPGNHDETVRDFVGHAFGPIEIEEEAVHVTQAGKKLLIFHGDILDAHIRFGRLDKLMGDLAYDFLLFANRWTNFIRRRFGYCYWSLASYIKNRLHKARSAIETFEEAAIEEARRRGLDGVVCGHIHQAEIRVLDETLYCNDGDWVESCTALLEDDHGHLEIVHWSERQRAVKSMLASNDVMVDTQGLVLSAAFAARS